ncbi:GGDEF domain-containing protein [Hyphomicrobium methylovorum]|uniref:sensor domain-containing protein n=1 Tax=Hyphomicrobium methylovorum TaxID=84 RepID=UPI0015E73E5B|nr:EAL domain-containing protein [Hyphomicrobium methylovorum]MBA2125927.1 GGDEF domain-containing protein [Hyphomicrobium methylovorum]
MAYNVEGLAKSSKPVKRPRQKASKPPYLSTSWGAAAFAAAVEHLGMVSITDASGRILHVNDEFVRQSKYDRDELIGQTHAILKSPQHTSEFWADAFMVLAERDVWRSPVMNRAKDGSFYWVDTIISTMRGPKGALKGYLSIQIDITTAVGRHVELQERTELLQAVVETFPGGLTAFDKNNRIILCNKKQRRLLEYPDELFEGNTTLEQLYRFNAERGEYGPGNVDDLVRERLGRASKRVAHSFERQRPNGTYLEIRGTPLAHGGFVTAHIDISDRKRDQEMIGRLANHDALTGLPNRTLFLKRARSALEHLGHGEMLALHCVGLDRFKIINDTLGHPTGDAILKAAAQRLANLPGTHAVSRLGGDEFGIIQVAPNSIEDVAAMGKAIIGALAEPFEIGSETVAAGGSVGIAIAPGDASNAEQLMVNADTALYRTKSIGRGSFGFFEQTMHERLQARHTIAMGLREAIANSKFELHYQPIVNVNSRRIVGCEALIRWYHPKRGLVPASEFIPIAEEAGYIEQIGEWVLKSACAEASRWPDNIWVAVNVSAVQFLGPNLVQQIVDASRSMSLSRLVLEITESVLIKDRDLATTTLNQLKKLGARIAIDDFGTGFSSLSYLQSFPFDKIKIDRSFVSDISNQKRSATLRRSIIQLGYNLGMTSVAEGVETEAQYAKLRSEGCVEAQGFLFSRPIPAAAVRALIAKSQ